MSFLRVKGFVRPSILVLALAALGAERHVPLPQFIDKAAEAGLHIHIVSGDPDEKKFLVESVGGGLAVIDFDNDGWMDVYIPNGSTIALAPGGHVTPLAQDTLRERRITVVSSVLDPDTASLAPVASVRRMAIGGDHTSVALKNRLRDTLRSRGLSVTDVGTDTTDAVDYPDIAAQVGRLVARKEADAGIVIDGAGLGSAIAANKIRGIRAAMCTSKTLARYAREHNGANVLTLGATLVTGDDAQAIVDTFLETATTEPRYLRRLAKIQRLEE